MPVIAIKKDERKIIGKNKREVYGILTDEDKRHDDYELLYVYDIMSRSAYGPSYVERHREAALRYYYRNKTSIRPRGRPKKKEKKNE